MFYEHIFLKHFQLLPYVQLFAYISSPQFSLNASCWQYKTEVMLSVLSAMSSLDWNELNSESNSCSVLRFLWRLQYLATMVIAISVKTNRTELPAMVPMNCFFLSQVCPLDLNTLPICVVCTWFSVVFKRNKGHTKYEKYIVMLN